MTLRSDEDGPRITAVENGAVAYQQPPIAAPEKTSACAELRAAKAKMDESEVLKYCRRAMPEESCRVCLGLKNQ
jgi:hypothetical protein